MTPAAVLPRGVVLSRLAGCSAKIGRVQDEPKAERQRLVCVECGDENRENAGCWIAFLDGEGQVLTFCPRCAAREFGNERVGSSAAN